MANASAARVSNMPYRPSIRGEIEKLGEGVATPTPRSGCYGLSWERMHYLSGRKQLDFAALVYCAKFISMER